MTYQIEKYFDVDSKFDIIFLIKVISSSLRNFFTILSLYLDTYIFFLLSLLFYCYKDHPYSVHFRITTVLIQVGALLIRLLIFPRTIGHAL